MIENAILESLIQDSRNIENIYEHLLEFGEKVSVDETINSVRSLFKRGLIKVVYPISLINVKRLDDYNINECWFELTNQGEEDCIKRKLMMSREELILYVVGDCFKCIENCSIKYLKNMLIKNDIQITNDELFEVLNSLNLAIDKEGIIFNMGERRKTGNGSRMLKK